jgi:hypothetical protein
VAFQQHCRKKLDCRRGLRAGVSGASPLPAAVVRRGPRSQAAAAVFHSPPTPMGRSWMFSSKRSQEGGRAAGGTSRTGALTLTGARGAISSTRSRTSTIWIAPVLARRPCGASTVRFESLITGILTKAPFELVAGVLSPPSRHQFAKLRPRCFGTSPRWRNPAVQFPTTVNRRA